MVEITNTPSTAMSDHEMIRQLESIAVCSVTFKLPWYTIAKIANKVMPNWIRSSEITCKIDVINGSDIGSKIAYIKWPQRRKLRVPLVHYFACLFDEDDHDSLLMLECTRVLNCILNDLGLNMSLKNDPETFRCWVYDIFNAIQQGLKEAKK